MGLVPETVYASSLVVETGGTTGPPIAATAVSAEEHILDQRRGDEGDDNDADQVHPAHTPEHAIV